MCATAKSAEHLLIPRLSYLLPACRRSLGHCYYHHDSLLRNFRLRPGHHLAGCRRFGVLPSLSPLFLLPSSFHPILPPSLYHSSSLPPSLLPLGKLRAASGIMGSPIEDLVLTLFLSPCALAQEARQASAEGRPVKEFVTGDVLVSEGGGREGGGEGQREERNKKVERRPFPPPSVTAPLLTAPPLRRPYRHR